MSQKCKSVAKVTLKKKEHIACTVNRLCEVPLPEFAAVHINNGNAPCCCQKCMNYFRNCAGGKTVPVATTATTSRKYAEPQYNTALRRQYELQDLQTLGAPSKKNDLDLTPRSKAAIAPKLTQKMNFPNAHTLYKNLVPLNVNDSIIRPRRKRAPRKKAGSNKDPSLYEPELRDFVEEIEKLEYVIPEPELELHHTAERFNFLQSFKNVYDINY